MVGLLKDKFDNKVSGARVFEDIVDLLLDDPEEHQFCLIADDLVKLSDGIKFDMDGPGGTDAFH